MASAPQSSRNQKKAANRRANIVVEENCRIIVQKIIDDFMLNDELKIYKFPPHFTSKQRAYVHEYVRGRRITSKSYGKGLLFSIDSKILNKKIIIFV